MHSSIKERVVECIIKGFPVDTFFYLNGFLLPVLAASLIGRFISLG